MTQYHDHINQHISMMERKQQKARPVTAHNALLDHTEKDDVADRFRKLREQTAVTQLERQQAAERRERAMAKVAFLLSLLPYALGAAVFAALLYGLWSHDITFEQVFANGGGR
jgi:hypothetical protein